MNRGERRVTCSVNLLRENREGRETALFFVQFCLLTNEIEYDKIGGPRAIAASGFHYNTRLALCQVEILHKNYKKNIPKFVYFAQRKNFFVTFHKIFCVFLCNLYIAIYGCIWYNVFTR